MIMTNTSVAKPPAVRRGVGAAVNQSNPDQLSPVVLYP
jgi:hypothetical protein